MSPKRIRTSSGLAITALTAGSLILSGCGGSSGSSAASGASPSAASSDSTSSSPSPSGSASAASTEPVTITVDSFGGIFDNFKKAGLLDDYKKLHPNVTVTYKETEQEADYWTALTTKLNSGSGLADIQPIEISRVALVTKQQGDKWLDLSKTAQASHIDEYPDAKKGAMTTSDGKVLGFGTDAGPMALCFRNDKLKAAGLPSTGDALAAKITSWDDYEAVGLQYKKATGKAWTDAAGGYYRLLTSVKSELNYNEDGDPTWDKNATVHAAFDRAAKAANEGLTAKLAQFSPPWNTAMSTGAFATIACPAWMLGYIKQQAGDKNAKNWSVMPLPGGQGGNWGGSYLSIPKGSKNAEAATELAAFLTSADSEAKEFKAGLAFPSNSKALDQISTVTDDYFSGADVGKIFGDSFKSAPNQTTGIDDGTINTALGNALTAVENNGLSADAAWSKAKSTIEDQTG